jgi:hypothetical protein
MEQQIELIKSAFEGNKELLISVRNLFFGYEISPSEKDLIKKTFASPELMKIMRNRLIPSIDKDAPLEVSKDMWTGFDMIGSNAEIISRTVEVRKNLISMLETALKLLENPDGQKVYINYDPALFQADSNGILLTSRNHFIGMVINQLNGLSVVANTKTETPTQIGKRIKKDSSQ